MHLKLLFAAMPAALLVLGSAVANAQTINEAGALACVNDKWDVKEPKKGHKLVDYAGRCVSVPDDPAEPKYTMECVGKYEYMPGRVPELAPTPLRVATRKSRVGRRVRTSRNTRTSTRAALGNTKALLAEAPTPWRN